MVRGCHRRSCRCGGAIAISLHGNSAAIDIAWSAPVLAIPQMTFGPAAFAAITLPMIVLSMGLGTLQGLGFLQAQGCRGGRDPRVGAGRNRVNAQCDLWRPSRDRSAHGRCDACCKRSWASASALLGSCRVCAAHLVHRFRRHIHCGTRRRASQILYLCACRSSDPRSPAGLVGEELFRAASLWRGGRLFWLRSLHLPFSALAPHFGHCLQDWLRRCFWNARSC